MALQEECAEAFEGSVECDETMFGGYRPGKHGWGAVGKVIVFGIYQRNGLVRVFAVNSRQREELLPLIETHTAKGCLYYTELHRQLARLCDLGRARQSCRGQQRQRHPQRPRSHQRHRRLLELCQKLVVSVSWCAQIVVCPKSSFIFIWPKLLSASTLASKTFTPCCIRL